MGLAKAAIVGALGVLSAAAATRLPRGEGPAVAWLRLEPGLELAELASPRPSDSGDSTVRVLRFDPALFELHLLNASAPGQGERLTAREWCLRNDLVAAINAAMYQEDRSTSLSLMRTRSHVNNPRVSKDMTILAFDPLEADVAPVRIVDRECEDFDRLRRSYGTLVQSIRMVSCKGRNVWAQQPRRSSTAAIGTDGRGRVLLVHVRSPYSTHDLIEILFDLPIGLERAMYAEGGPEAQMYIRSGTREFEFVGGYPAGLVPGEGRAPAWRIPNVVGISRRAAPADP